MSAPPAGWSTTGGGYGPPGAPGGAPSYPAYPPGPAYPGYGPPGQQQPQYGHPGQQQPQYGHPGQQQPQYGHPGQQQPQYGHPGQQPPYGADVSAITMVPTSSHSGNIPRGLEYLTAVDQLLVHQKVELLEAFVGFESKNKYTVKNSLGQKVYYAVEDSDCLTRNCCGPWRPFDMRIMDANKEELIHLNRPLACSSCWFPCCLQKLEVTSPPGTLIGSIEQDWSILFPQFSVKDASGNTILKIEGPLCTFSLCGDVEFTVRSAATNQKVGKISKQWTGLLKEAFTDTDNFGVSFPMDLDVRMKAVMLGAVFLIDFMFFEKVGGDERDRPGMF
ncbi:unnamed protein product [Notodromas monacha]|uniref:Phospholipid scramblase n=1 Tax=Notodromas monacha TaxID=399045 RepID=A0A7R9BPT7_9CRUS|nr:unnamed protein product [Notodromas monacha]CAG0919456.1 unnamed protein product [Notodromas monacha]